MEILLWLVPPVAVTVLAMVWAGWVGREGRGEVDRDEALRRLTAALEQDPHARRTPSAGSPPMPRERSTGVAQRRGLPVDGARPEPQAERGSQPSPTQERRAS